VPPALATALTGSGLPIVDTMVSVNVVHIASLGARHFGLLRGKNGRGVDETWLIAAGYFVSMPVYAATCWGGTSAMLGCSQCSPDWWQPC